MTAKVHIATLGCPKNTVDSKVLKDLFISNNFIITDNESNADILIVNTCGFVKDAKEESIEEILRLVNIKDKDKILIVFGCLAQRYRKDLTLEIPEIDGIFGVGEDKNIVEFCKTFNFNSSHNVSKPNNKIIPSSYAYIKIADGCDKRCSYCIIPSIRGRFRSIDPELILKESETYLSNGIKELILVAQDITNYGKDLKDYNLISLLKDLISIKGKFYIRLLYLYPTLITNELIDFIAGEDKIHNYLDIPLQHSEDRILRLMKRRGNKKEYLKLILHIRKIIPDIVLRTTFIVGFPTETKEEFDGLLDFIEEVRFERLGVFIYSKEENTSAFWLKPHLFEKTKLARFNEIMKHQSLISLEKNEETIYKQFEALVDEIDNDIVIARLYSHSPEIDGVVLIKNTKKKQIKVGDFINVEIIEALNYDLKGIII